MNGDTTSVHRYEGGQEFLQAILRETTYVTINNVNDQIIIIVNNKIFLYKNNILSYKNIYQTNDVIHQTYGRHEKDLLIRTTNYIAHYNGADIEHIYTFSNNRTGSAGGTAIFDNEVFFCCSDYENNKFYILKGKLN